MMDTRMEGVGDVLQALGFEHATFRPDSSSLHMHLQ